MAQLPNDVAALVELATSHAEGAQPLFEGHLESVASLYQVHPERVERARTAFTTPEAHRLASELVQQTPRLPAAPPSQPPSRLPAKDASTLVLEALASEATRELVMRAPLELAAVQLGAHPFVVEEARQRLFR